MIQYLLEIRKSADENQLDEIELERAIAMSLNICKFYFQIED